MGVSWDYRNNWRQPLLSRRSVCKAVTMKSQQLITAREAASRLGVTRHAIVRRVHRGTLRPVAKLPGKTGAFLFDPATIRPGRKGSAA